MMRLCAVSVDLDGIDCYRALHGLPTRDQGRHAVYDVALGRLWDFARAEALPLTSFAIGRDLERARSAAMLRDLARDGHPVENHTWSHRYDLLTQDRDVLIDEVGLGQSAIEAVTDRRPRGFRAPGYAVDDRLLDVLEAEGMAFDASVFSCPPYYLAKAAVMAWMLLMGRRSAARLDDVRVLAAPARPYRPGRPWHRPGDRALVEIPMTVTRGVRAPFIGTSLCMAGARGARWLARACVGLPMVSLELHAIDLLDAGDGLEDLTAHQPDVRIAWARKREALVSALAVLRDAGYRFVTLEQMAEAAASVVRR
jgi:hypothetical protein